MYTKPDLFLQFVAGYTHCAYWDLINLFSFLLRRAKVSNPSAIHLSPQCPGASGQALDQLHDHNHMSVMGKTVRQIDR